MNELYEKLNAKIPRDVISLRDGGGGRKLSYLEGHYVINRMNEIFGQGNWCYQTVEMKPVFVGEVDGKNVAHYIAKVNLTIVIGERTVTFSDYGYGDGMDKYNPGKAHELAVKEAVTDGVKRCAKSLGMSLGLALYDKTQENVADAPTEVKPKARAGNSSRTVANKPAGVSNANAAPVGNTGETAGNSSGGTEAAPVDEDEMKTLAISKVRVAVAKKKTTVEDLQEFVSVKFGVAKEPRVSSMIAKLNAAQAAKFLDYINPLAA